MLRHASRQLLGAAAAATSCRQAGCLPGAAAVGAARCMAAASAVAPEAQVTLPDLPYDYSALEPAISGEIMRLHHGKHHAAYVAGFNKAMEQLGEAQARRDAQGIVALQRAITFNGGGHVNHSIFWTNLAPVSEGGGSPPEGPLKAAVQAQFGSLDALIARMSAAGAGVQGSGWVWLGVSDQKKLAVATTMNQDACITTGLVPLLGIDVWEHAYYLQYKNVRPDYLKNIWKVVNWKDVEQRYAAAM
uniref:Superoxide dismutase n=1 Tax=Closterium ehrenbergii TaxID=102165 RepID=A0A4Y1PAN1_CLOEH|nr:mitochondrial manganese superoxide dismutase [Closterium ehrenbergii]